MKLVVGLGNPGDRYVGTYHNVGFIAIDILANRLGAPDYIEKDDALLCDTRVKGDKVILCKPLTFMNLSGDAVSRISRYYKIDPKDIIVIYDDIDIKKGTVRVRENGSAGTHNGMRDIVEKLGSTDFPRVRIGIGLKPSFMDLADYVLSHIQPFEKPIILKAADKACDFVIDRLNGVPWQDKTVTVE